MSKTESGPRRQGAGSFFGRRRGKTLTALHAGLIRQMLPSLIVDLERPAPPNLALLFPAAANRIRVEIGFGGGEHLAHEAENHPDIGFFGVEPFVNGMAKLLALVSRKELSNIRLYDFDAALLLDWLPADSITQIDLLYPDPWPKKRQNKRRFISDANLSKIARVLVPGGKLCVASDIDGYINWTLLHVLAHGGLVWDAKDADDWRLPYDGWEGTRYEAKALREGRAPVYLTFSKPVRALV